MSFSESLSLLRELPGKFEEIGSLWPSSRSLSRAIVASIRDRPDPKRILEVGPGTGPFTREILAAMGDSDKLRICEINAQLLRSLKKQLEGDSRFLRHHGRVRFFQGPVQSLDEELSGGLFDVIICGLPFSNFNLYGSNSPPLAALSMKQHFDDTPLLRNRSRARGERACPGEASFPKWSSRFSDSFTVCWGVPGRLFFLSITVCGRFHHCFRCPAERHA
jgi:phospholipid N-methyltransferase